MKAIPLILFVSFVSAPAQLLAADDLQALKNAINAVSGLPLNNAFDQKGIDALKLPTKQALERALNSSIFNQGNWKDGKFVRAALREVDKASRDPKACVSLYGPINGKGADGRRQIVGIRIDSTRDSRSVAGLKRSVELRVWVNRAGKQPVLMLQDKFARRPVAVPLRRGRRN